MIKGDIFVIVSMPTKEAPFLVNLTNFSVHISTTPLMRFLLSIHQVLVRFARCFRDKKYR